MSACIKARRHEFVSALALRGRCFRSSSRNHKGQLDSYGKSRIKEEIRLVYACSTVYCFPRTMRILILTPVTHFHSPFVLRSLFAELVGKGIDFHVILTPKISEKKNASNSLNAVIRNSGLPYLLLMMAMNLKYNLFRLREALTRRSLKERRYLRPGDTCSAFGISNRTFRSVNGKECVEYAKAISPDVILCVFFNQILKKDLMACAKDLCLNLHPSLLPAYKGMSPILWMLAEGSSTGGVTLHRLTEELDGGEIIAQEAFSITPEDSFFTTYAKAAERGGNLLVRILSDWEHLPPGVPQPQGEGKAYGPITREALSRILARRSFLRFPQ